MLPEVTEIQTLQHIAIEIYYLIKLKYILIEDSQWFNSKNSIQEN